jgi:NMD protein affecting ribosome stability and mRNA decay
MNIFRITIRMSDGSCGKCHGIFKDAFEAVLQVAADFPDARSVSAIFVMKGGAQ